jgi:hypothetical protein
VFLKFSDSSVRIFAAWLNMSVSQLRLPSSMLGERPQPPSAIAINRQSRDSMRQAWPKVRVVSQLPVNEPSSFWKSKA